MNRHGALNRMYRLVWSDHLQTYVVAAENARSQGKGSSKAGRRLLAVLGFGLSGVSLGLSAFAQTAPPPKALPSGGQLVAGQAQIVSNAGAGQMNIVQGTPRAAIDWQSFNVGAQAQVNFVQPSASAVTLNRVLGSDASQIFGRISSNGQVFLSNPNGVYFSPSAKVDVGGLIATTHAISNADFMAGKASFARAGSSGAVVNDGELQAKLGGYIALLAPEVRNEGVIVAQAGTVALAAGESFSLQLNGNRLAAVQVTAGQIKTLVDNRQAVLAPDGLIILSARAAQSLGGAVIKHSGTLQANSLQERGGRIVLEADEIQLASGASVQARGASGGGTVLIGGDWQGSGTVYQARKVEAEAGSSVDVSASRDGDGGKAVLWSNAHQAGTTTRVQGQVLARGAGSGSGGQIETSGHALLLEGSQVNAGAGGQWLIDPYNVTISNGSTQAGGSGVTAAGGGSWTPSASGSTISNSLINSALNNGQNVSITTAGAGAEAGNIAVNGAINKSSGGIANLSLIADGSITVAANITMGSSSANSGAVLLKAKSGITQNAVTIKTFGQNVTFWSNSSNSGEGRIVVGTGAKIDTGTSTNSAAVGAATSGGGRITLGGGLDDGANGGVAGDGIPDGYATSATANPLVLGVAATPAVSPGPALWSGGGNVQVRGKSTGSNSGTSVLGSGGLTIDSGTGSIELTGQTLVTGGNGRGVLLNAWGDSATPTVIRSLSSAANAISITGDSSASTGYVSGNDRTGIDIGFGNSAGASASISAPNGGGIVMVGRSPIAGNSGIDLNFVDILANSGAISLNGGVQGVTLGSSSNSNVTLGAKAGSAVTSSSSAISLTGDIITSGNATAVQGSGSVTLKPSTNSNTIAVGNGAPAQSLSNLNLATNFFDGSGAIKSGFSLVTVGSSAGTGVINVNGTSSDTLNFVNPMRFLTGGTADINLRGNSVYTGAGTHSSLSVNAGGAATLSGAIRSASIALDVTLTGNFNDVLSNNSLSGHNGWCSVCVNQGSSILSSGGNISLTGVAPNAASGTFAPSAVVVQSATLDASTPGKASASTIQINGSYTGSSTSPGTTWGVTGVTLTGSSSVFKADGAIKVTGDAGTPWYGSSGTDLGVDIRGGSWTVAPASGKGSITITGTARQSSYASVGLYYGDLAIAGAVDTTINTGAASTASTGFLIQSGHSLSSSSSGSLTISPVQGNISIAGSLSNTAGSDALLNTQGNNNIFVTGSIAAGAGNLSLAAGSDLARGVSSGGNISAQGNITGTGQLLFYTGSVAGTSISSPINGSSSWLASGSGDFRYNRQYLDPVGALAVGNGKNYVLYREQPTLSLSGLSNTSKVYGNTDPAAPMPTGVSGALNGDTLAQIAPSALSRVAGENVGSYRYGGTSSQLGYAFAPINVALNISPRPLTLSGTRVYDASSNISGNLLTVTNLVGADVLQLSGTGQLSLKDVGSRSLSDSSGLILGGSAASNYTLTGASGSILITPKTIASTATAPSSKVYDGSTAAYGSSASLAAAEAPGSGTSSDLRPYAGDTLSLSGSALGSYNSKDVATANTITFSGAGLTLTGASAGNYILQQASNSQAATITPKSLTPTGLSANNKAYDGSTAATLSGTATLLASEAVGTGSAVDGKPYAADAVALSGTPVGTFNSANVAGANSVSVTGLSLSGAQASNYSLASYPSLSASIAPALLTVTANADAKFVTTADLAGFNGVSYAGFAKGENASVLSGSLSISRSNPSQELVGNYAGVLVPSGLSAANYAINYVNGDYRIIPADQLLIKVTNQNTVYGSSPSYAVYSAQYMAGGNTLTNLSLVSNSGNQYRYADANGAETSFTLAANNALLSSSGNLRVGNYSVGGTATQIAGQYSALNFVGNLSVSQKALTPSVASGLSRVYDGTTTMSGLTLASSDAIAADALTLSGLGNFSARNVGTNLAYTVQALTLGGSDAGNYYLASGSSFSGSNGVITARPLLISAPIISKVYDGTTAYAVTAGDLLSMGSGLVGGDSLSNATLSFASKMAGLNNRTVTPSAAVIADGNNGNNYSVSYASNALSSISPLNLTLAAPSVNKVYDGSNAASGLASLVAGAYVAGDSLQSNSLVFANSHAGTGKTVNVSNALIYDALGADMSGNYTISYQANTSSSISPKTLTATLNNGPVSKVYDSNSDAPSGFTPGWSLSGFISGDSSAQLNTGSVAFNSSHVATASQIIVSGLSIGSISGSNGSLSSDYQLGASSQSVAASITPKTLSASLSNTGVSKVYDASTQAPSGFVPSFALTGLIAGDSAASIQAGSVQYNSKDVATASQLNASGLTIGTIGGSNSSAASDYQLASSSASVAATITPKSLTPSGLSVAASKVYDGTTGVTLLGRAALASPQAPGSGNGSDGTPYSGDAIGLSGVPIGTYNSANVADATGVAISNLSLVGAQASNYSLASYPLLAASISRAPLSITANADAKFVTTADASGYNGVNYTGFVHGETRTVLSGTASVTRSNSAEAVGSYAGVLVPSGQSAANYAISFVNGDYKIIPADQLLIKVQNQNSGYGTSPLYSVASAQYMLGGTTLTDLTLLSHSGNQYVFADANGAQTGFTLAASNPLFSGSNHLRVGNYSVAGVNNSISGQYSALNFVGNLTVDQAALSPSASGGLSKVYDGTTAMNGLNLSMGGQLSGDLLSANGSGAFSSRNAGSPVDYTVSNLSLSGSDAGNYYLAGDGHSFSGHDGAITPRAITFTAPIISKVYDGGTAYTSSAADLNAMAGVLVGGDQLTGMQLEFSSKMAGSNNRSVSASLAQIADGNQGRNYTVSYAGNQASTITPLAISLLAPSVSKVYDGSTAASGLASVSSGAFVGGDSLIADTLSFADAHAGSGKQLIVSNALVRDAQGADMSGNYQFSYLSSLSSSITPKTLTANIVNGGVSKVYDGSNSAPGGYTPTWSVSGLIAGDSAASLAYTQAGYNSSHVATANQLTFSGLSLSGISGSNGSLSSDYQLGSNQANTAASITPATLTAQLANTGVAKVYDATTQAPAGFGPLWSVTGLVAGDSAASIKAATLAYNSKDVAYASQLRASGLTIGAISGSNSSAASDYQLAASSSAVAASITAKSLTPGGLAVGSKVYDGTNSAPLTGTASLAGAQAPGSGSSSDGIPYAGDQIALAGTPVGSFNSSDVASANTVSVSGLSLTGAQSSNYSLASYPSLSGSIQRAGLTISANLDAKFVTTPDVAGFNGVHYEGFVHGETPAVLSGTATVSRSNTDQVVGQYAGVLVPSGQTAANYSITYVNGDYHIIPADQLLVKVRNQSDGYGSPSSYGIASAQYMAGGVTLTDLTLSSRVGDRFSFVDANNDASAFTITPGSPQMSSSGNLRVGNYLMSGVDQSLSGQYKALEVVGNLTVTPKALTPSVKDGLSKVYDGTTGMNQLNLNAGGQLAGDALSLSGNGAFASRNAGSGLAYTVSQLSLSGSDADNYYLASASNSFSGNNGTITPRAVTLTAPVISKVYDGGTSYSATATDLSAIGSVLVGGDSLSSIDLSYTSKMAGSGNRSVNAANASIQDGNNGLNYLVSYAGNDSSSITPLSITLAAPTVSKVYDASLTANGLAQLSAGAFAASDVLSSNSLAYTDSHAGLGKTVNASKALILDAQGADMSGNYTISYLANTSSSISPKTLTATLNNEGTSKVYDGSTAAPSGWAPSWSWAGLVGGDSAASLNFLSASFNSSHVATASQISVGGLSLAGISGSNSSLASDYQLSANQASVAASITPASLSVSLNNSSLTKVYDASTQAPQGFTPIFGVSGLIAGDSAANIGWSTAFYNSKDVWSAQQLTVQGLSLSGISGSLASQASDYQLSNTSASAAASISAKRLTPGGLSVAPSKVYDGTRGVNLQGQASLGAAEAAGTGNSLDGLAYLGDAVGLSGVPVGLYNSADVASANAVSISHLSLSGAQAGNYVLAAYPSLAASISKATLTVTANLDAKFVTTADEAGYNGINYSGFVHGQNDSVLSGKASIARINTDQAVGNYRGVLQVSGLDAANYEIRYVNGDYRIIPADQLLVKVQNNSVGYGALPNYSVRVAQYMAHGEALSDLVPTAINGNQFSFRDRSGNLIVFTLQPGGASYSSAGQLQVGNYTMTADQVNVGSAYKALNIVGNLAVTPKALDPVVGGLTKVYDGTNAMSGLSTELSGSLRGDQIALQGSGAFSSTHAGTQLGYTVSNLGLSGSDARNYYLRGDGQAIIGQDGQITPRLLTLELLNSGVQKVYDGNTSAPPNFQPQWRVSGFAAGDNAALLSWLQALYDNPKVGQDKRLSVDGIQLAALQGSLGSLASDYRIEGSSRSVAASITAIPEPLPVPPPPFTPPVTPPDAGGGSQGSSGTPSLPVDPQTQVPVGPRIEIDPRSAEPEKHDGGAAASSANQPVSAAALLSQTAADARSQAGCEALSIDVLRAASASVEGQAQVSLPDTCLAEAGQGFSIDLRQLLDGGQAAEVLSIRKSDGGALPAWLSHFAERKLLVASQVPSGALPLSLHIQGKNGSTQLLIKRRTN
ncbi:hypothetical protein DBR47_17055 [Paucibacter sp. KBW04]|uniref:YDG domain-containing protein n=1 Tax=Paucibacter sp. KBW04 TaxID=2153361 RepID=UPI000F584084|nr:YDG domain-containing protein [Paucibacter sp. KBW04]RQO56255.1 hypothetical protein DBR47_17055 [Paucibacter sp. KBW04]